MMIEILNIIFGKPILQSWGPLDPKIWGGLGGRNRQKVRFIITKIKKIHIFPKIWGGAAAPPAPPAADPMSTVYCTSLRTSTSTVVHVYLDI